MDSGSDHTIKIGMDCLLDGGGGGGGVNRTYCRWVGCVVTVVSVGVRGCVWIAW